MGTMNFRVGWCRRLFIYVLIIFFFMGCAIGAGMSTRRTTSLIEFLYPDEKVTQVTSDPKLSFPLKLGISFIPDVQASAVAEHEVAKGSTFAQKWIGVSTIQLSDKKKNDLMEKVAAVFKNNPSFGTVELLPPTYLTPKGGFSNLDKIRLMKDIDVILLLSYDQIQRIDEGASSALYWTWVGLYAVPGEKNDTQTIIDAAAYDIASRKMLFRASGKSHVEDSATPINLSEELRKNSYNGFDKAIADLVGNLKQQIDNFTYKVNTK